MVRAKDMSMQNEQMVGYFSMEIALEAGLPTYTAAAWACWPATLSGQRRI
jgi:hypothetical protein